MKWGLWDLKGLNGDYGVLKVIKGGLWGSIQDEVGSVGF